VNLRDVVREWWDENYQLEDDELPIQIEVDYAQEPCPEAQKELEHVKRDIVLDIPQVGDVENPLLDISSSDSGEEVLHDSVESALDSGEEVLLLGVNVRALDEDLRTLLGEEEMILSRRIRSRQRFPEPVSKNKLVKNHGKIQ